MFTCYFPILAGLGLWTWTFEWILLPSSVFSSFFPPKQSFESCNVAFLQFMSSQIVKKPTKNNEVRISQQRTNMTQTWLFRLYAHKFCIYTLFILNNYQSKSTTYNECIIGFNLTNVWTVTAKARLKSVPWKCLYASQLSLTKVQCVRRH